MLLCFGLCLCLVLLLSSGSAIKRLSESDGIGAISDSILSLISKHDSVAVFFGIEADGHKDSSAPESVPVIPTFSYTQILDAEEYIEEHNSENLQRSGVDPLSDGVISSGYSFRRNPMYLVYEGEDEYEFHSGVDIAADAGTEIRSYLDGVVETCALSSSYGYYVCIDHGGGLKTLYAHASRLLCTEGDQVAAGQTIALVGDTGRATGAHLHFEVYKDGETKNPKEYIPSLYN